MLVDDEEVDELRIAPAHQDEPRQRDGQRQRERRANRAPGAARASRRAASEKEQRRGGDEHGGDRTLDQHRRAPSRRRRARYQRAPPAAAPCRAHRQRHATHVERSCRGMSRAVCAMNPNSGPSGEDRQRQQRGRARRTCAPRADRQRERGEAALSSDGRRAANSLGPRRANAAAVAQYTSGGFSKYLT